MWLIGWLFFGIIMFAIYILAGLYISRDITQSTTYILTWIIYSCLCFTLLNIGLLAYFWETVRNKVGPTGIRGPGGETGDSGITGTCGIGATQSYLIMTLNTYIDDLYKAKTGNSILNQETQKFPSVYLTNKIATQAGSRQYNVIVANLSSENKPVENIVNYLKSIWKEWFELLYTGNPKWFLDEYGDEDYSWTGESPFKEIRKYDIYYWGITRTFRPLKAEICRTTPDYQSSKVPLVETTPRLKILETNDYSYLGDDYKTRGDPDASWWRPNKQDLGADTYYPVGDVITVGNKGKVYFNMHKSKVQIGDMVMDSPSKRSTKYGRGNGPDMRSIIISGDVADATGFTPKMYIGGDQGLIIGTPKCPSGYTALGDVLYQGDYTNGANIKCVPEDCIEDNNRDDTFYAPWSQRGVVNVQNDWTRENKSATGDNGYNLMRGNNRDSLKRIKSKCLKSTRVQQTKEPEPEFESLGVGWYGHPYKLDPRYSVFAFLGMVPEGMIVHKATGRRFYIIHYGGEEINIYNVLDYSDDTNKFDNALQVELSGTSARVLSRPLSRKDNRQQWEIILESDKKFLKLKNKNNSKYLYVGLQPITGESQFSVIDLDFANYKTNPIYSQMTDDQIAANTTFTFISTFGTQMDIIDRGGSSGAKYVVGNRVRISSAPGQPIYLFGIFIYGESGNILNLPPTSDTASGASAAASSSSVYQGHVAGNAMKIVGENRNRNINNAINGDNLIIESNQSRQITGLWNTWEANGVYAAMTNSDGSASTGGDWWEYVFQTPTQIAAVEIWGGSDEPNRFKNLAIEIFDDTRFAADNNSDPVWVGNTGGSVNSLGYQTFIIAKNGLIRHQ